MRMHRIRDFITTSQVDSSGIITSTDIHIFQDLIGNILEIGTTLNSLPQRTDFTLNVVDWDDTLHTRFHQLQLAKFNENRGELGDEVVKAYGLGRFIHDFYSKHGLVKEFGNILEGSDKTHKTLILTAGKETIQRMKCEASGLYGNAPEISIVSASSLKPQEIVRYIIEVLGFIPGKIIIYDDKTQYYEKSAGPIARVLRCEVVLDKVTLSQYRTDTIEHIGQTIYRPTTI